MSVAIYLFLDYDGVLHPDDAYRAPGGGAYLKCGGELFQHAAALEQSLKPFSTVHIVLATSWVRVWGFSAAKRRLPPGLQARVVDATYRRGYSPDGWEDWPRYTRIHGQVMRHQLTHWLALDDDTAHWPATERHRLVSPQPSVGLQSDDLAMLVRRLTVLKTSAGSYR
jgi:hypothetical protein